MFLGDEQKKSMTLFIFPQNKKILYRKKKPFPEHKLVLFCFQKKNPSK